MRRVHRFKSLWDGLKTIGADIEGEVLDLGQDAIELPGKALSAVEAGAAKVYHFTEAELETLLDKAKALGAAELGKITGEGAPNPAQPPADPSSASPQPEVKESTDAQTSPQNAAP